MCRVQEGGTQSRSDFEGDEVSPKPEVFEERRIEGRTVSDVCLDTAWLHKDDGQTGPSASEQSDRR